MGKYIYLKILMSESWAGGESTEPWRKLAYRPERIILTPVRSRSWEFGFNSIWI